MDYVKNDAGLLVPNGKLILKGEYKFQHFRKGELIDEWSDENIIVNEGLNSLLGVYLQGATQITTWYLGLFEGNYTPVATVTAATIASASTECTAYTDLTRPTWTPAAPASQVITNAASPAAFTFNATKTIYGAFLVSNNTKSGTSGVLLSAAQFGSSKVVNNLDVLNVTYQFTASSV
jgi:hypothetical protein